MILAGVRSNDELQAQKAKEEASNHSASTSPGWEAALSYLYVILWIFLSATVILFNKCGPPELRC